ncbi:putative amidohydrolase [Methanolinea mesophila]|uniref:nitrilase-related carbon-nitrogen hydrolase n=1 Tax=Methanolinea mesophila TaxID=547055 RepID=UPI001AE3B57D|nr:nitrilase-related carbon-nitrogen hydrolase [Methanolinea mesophila]MBP1928428.1 putative amidohydrolase [Methanolinea mesophila]
MPVLHSVQMSPVWEDPKKGLEKAEIFVAKAATNNGMLVAFPEQFATGWDPTSRKNLQARDGQIATTLSRLAKEYGIAVLGSFRERHSPLPRNTAMVFDSGGDEVAAYSKCHPFSPAGEECWYGPGDNISVFTLGGVTFGIAICYDLRFSDIFAAYSRAGVDAVVVPSAWPGSRLEHWELFIRARAVEFQMYVAGVNTTGVTPVDTYLGGTMTANPWGKIISRAGEEETIVASEIDPSLVLEVRSRFPVERDRRPELYLRLHEREKG